MGDSRLFTLGQPLAHEQIICVESRRLRGVSATIAGKSQLSYFASRADLPAHLAMKVDPMVPWEVSEVRSHASRSSGSFTIDHDEAAGNPSQFRQ
ncbi:MAG: hypothetical protein AUH43_20760 [Acidobacteria bacterium 13_1_40CM_65_14]|nr:MAG: hypothetical protein AUH43_20760 [Acidobacteria bacterium 13_1_40CM_65_14]OLC79651.1 MAG: hypothetical protein AUH72_14135 [Acidobacteria bacterium 13_1_40CM_4_65_8]OLD21563.1 MAG: hypothetical protein AUJ01_01960 [Acidobacteria bacterium 13_1_40CM_3_65_5]